MLKLQSIQTNHIGNFLSSYTLNYQLPDGSIKEYDVVSRYGSKQMNLPPLSKHNIHTESAIANAVSLIVFNESHDKILVCKEFRLGINDWVYGFPGGLVDCGESIRQAAARELYEETGLHLGNIIDTLAASYTSAPITNEMVNILICEARGEIRPSDNPIEPIESQWMTKDEIRTLLATPHPKFTSRFQTFAYMWAYGIK